MDKIINKHIDELEELERQLNIIMDKEISNMNIDAVIADPQKELSRVVESINSIFLSEYADKAIELGFDFGKKINERIKLDKTIKVDKSKDPNLND